MCTCADSAAFTLQCTRRLKRWERKRYFCYTNTLWHFSPSFYSWINKILDWVVYFLDSLPACWKSPPSFCIPEALLCRAFYFTFLLLFPFPLCVPKSKLLLLLRAGLCNSNLCNRIATLSTSICSPQSTLNVFARVQSQVFQIYIIDLVSQGEREREREK